MKNALESIFGKKISGVRVVPLVLKIITIFMIFLLLSNFASNFINLMLNRGELIKLMNQLLVKELKELYTFCVNQHEIYFFNQDLEGSIKAIKENASLPLKGEKSLAFGVFPDGDILFSSSKTIEMDSFQDMEALEEMQEAYEGGSPEGSILFKHNGDEFFGIYKFNPEWGVFLVRAEELNEFYQESWNIFKNISIIIIIVTLLCAGIGIFLIRYILRFVNVITSNIMAMQEKQSIELIDLSKAPNDDITFLGMSFNALSSTISNLMNIFIKFVAEDVAQRAYKERIIRLEGNPKELTILFSDIKGFTFMTETLGTDIINLLNMHYERAIRHVQDNGGIVGSIIGDALLVVFGTMDGFRKNKSYMAVRTAYQIQEVAASLRMQMNKRKEEIVKQRGGLTAEEEKIYRAVLIEVGVGLDGGEVFYGNIGSTRRMTNTVIGDNVNSAARLEGLTRIYKVPVICSEYVKAEIEKDYDDYHFLEIDMVQVKGKTEGKKVFWPIKRENMDRELQKDIELFAEGLNNYYRGRWAEANSRFKNCALPIAEVFRERTRTTSAPKGWTGIWTMKTK